MAHRFGETSWEFEAEEAKHRPKKKKKVKPSSAPGLGYVSFESFDPNYSFVAILGDGTPEISGGLGGWDIIARPRRRGEVEWNGQDPLQIDIPILFDDFELGVSLEDEILSLERMAGLKGDEPPLLIFNSGGVIPHDYHGDTWREWVIKELKWGDADRNEFGNRVRQAVTVTVLEYIEDTSLSAASSAERRRGHAKSKQKKKGKAERGAKKKYWVVKHGESFEYIAAHALGKSSRWHELKRLNPKLKKFDAKKPLPNGTAVRLP